MSRESIELAEAAYAMLARRDLDAFPALIHPEVEFRSLLAETDGKTYRGHEGVTAWWNDMAESLGG